MKRIVILCDGIWNRPDESSEGIPVPTNVVKLAEAIDRAGNGIRQMMFYDAGIGSTGSVLERLYEGATGAGISANIQQAYRFVVQQFEVGDELFLFGFSRGAFTVRSLSGLIRNAGILRRDALHILPDAYTLYRSRRKASHPRAREATLLRKTYAVEDVSPIAFIGVWDTVGSLGNPLLLGRLSPGNRFHDTNLSTYVKEAYQALAVDETRRNFAPTLWHQQPGAEGQVLEQRWFAGAHSNVGGGYPDAGLSDVALGWLASKAREAGLAIGEMPLAPNPRGTLVHSWKGFYRLLPSRRRPIDVPNKDGPTFEPLDPSVVERFRAEAGYRPANLQDYLRRHADLLG